MSAGQAIGVVMALAGILMSFEGNPCSMERGASVTGQTID